jgi:signal transduction histidine kinase
VRTRLFQTDAFRLAAIYTAVFALTMAAIGFSVTVLTRDALRGQILRFAGADNAAVQSGYRGGNVREAIEVVQQRMSAPGASDYFLLQQNGRAIAGNLPPMTDQPGIRALRAPDGHTILGMSQAMAPGLFAFSGSDLSRVNDVESRILSTMLWLFLLGLVAAAASGFLVSRAFLRRSDAMAKACRAIMDGDLKARIPLRGTRDEMDRLAAIINEMLDRIATLMGNLRQVTNDIAHDLRTPVTHLRHGLESALSEPPSTHAAAIDIAIRKTDEMLELFAALLRIAQIEGGARRAAFATLDLQEALTSLGDTFGAVAEEAGHKLSVGPLSTATIRGDRALLVQLFANLIENAIVHTPEGTRIRLDLFQPNPGQVSVIVSDNGPGVPPEEHERLLRPLYRREASRGTPGHGLGLALVAAIADLHAASLKIEPLERGFSVHLTFAAA